MSFLWEWRLFLFSNYDKQIKPHQNPDSKLRGCLSYFHHFSLFIRFIYNHHIMLSWLFLYCARDVKPSNATWRGVTCFYLLLKQSRTLHHEPTSAGFGSRSTWQNHLHELPISAGGYRVQKSNKIVIKVRKTWSPLLKRPVLTVIQLVSGLLKM